MSGENDREEIKQIDSPMKSNFKFYGTSTVIVLLLSLAAYFGYQQYKIYDFEKRYKNAPVGSLIKTGTMKRNRSEHVNIPLKDNTILVVGGNKGAEIFNPKTGQYKLINRNLENISFAFNDYYILKNGDILLANKYLFQQKSKKIAKIKNYDDFYKNEILNGNALIFNNTYFFNDNIVFSNTNNQTINCYNQNNNTIENCKFSKEIKKYFTPFNYFSEDANYSIMLDYNSDKISTSDFIRDYYFGRANVPTNLSIIKNNQQVFKIHCPSKIPLYNGKNILHAKNNIFFVDENSNLLVYSIQKNECEKKISIPHFYNQTKMFFYNDNIVFISPVVKGNRAIYITTYDIKQNKIINELKIKYKTCARNPHVIRSYDAIIFENNILINGGQSGIEKYSSSVKDSYLIKI